ncbi:MAG: DUF975 family protein [Bacteroidales bacterium]|nr:DUF975 family protein [Bacteroidales bacterium]
MNNQDYKNAALDALRGKWAPAVLLMLLYLVIYFVIAGPVQYFAQTLDPASPSPMLLWAALGTFLGGIFLITPLGVGVQNAFLGLVRSGDDNLTRNAFRLGFAQGYGRTLLTQLLRGIFIYLWSLLLFIPGLIMNYAYAMVPYLLKDQPELSPMEVIRTSRKMMKGHKFDLFYLHLSFIGWALLCVFTLGIGYLWLMPYIASAECAFYEDVRSQYLGATAASE